MARRVSAPASRHLLTGALRPLREAAGLDPAGPPESALRQLVRARRGRRLHTRIALGVTLALTLVAAVGLTPGTATGVLLFAVSVALLGLPHGATDLLLARSLVGRRWSARWAWMTAGAYVVLALLVVAFWIAAPLAGLIGFALLSLLHFGLADVEAGSRAEGWTAVEVVGRGSLALVVPVLFHPEAIGQVVAWLVPGTSPGVFLEPLPPLFDLLLGWMLGAVLITFVRDLTSGPRRRTRAYEMAALGAAAAMLPPLAFFALYFCGWHSMRHAIDMAAALPEARRGGWAAAVAYARISAPLSLAALAMAAFAYTLLRPTTPADAALMQVVFVGLAALTVPHMLLVDVRRALARRQREPGPAPAARTTLAGAPAP